MTQAVALQADHQQEPTATLASHKLPRNVLCAIHEYQWHMHTPCACHNEWVQCL
jgi:hypothetical protein